MGGLDVAARAMTEMNQMMRAYRADRAGRRERMLSWTGGEEESARTTFRPEEEGWDFSRFLCPACGYLSGEGADRCPACLERGLTDLSSPDNADRLRMWEHERRQRIPSVISVALAATLLLLVLVSIYLAAGAPLAWGIAFPAALVAFLLLRRPMSVLLLRLRHRRPHRWKLPLSPSKGRRSTGRIEAGRAEGAELLRAPFSGRSCLAWQVCVLFDTPGDARPPEWVLQEVEAVDFQVGATQIPGERIMLQTPLEAMSGERLEQAGVDWHRFLRERGLYAEEGTFELFEALLSPGQEVQLERTTPQAAYVVRSG